MPKFKVPYTYEMFGEYNVEAETLEEAIDMVKSDDEKYPIQNSDEYVDGSFYIDEELAIMMNRKEVER